MSSTVNRNILANFLGGLNSGILFFICVPFYVSFLGVESYALIGLFTSFVAISALLDLGMSPTIMREMAKFRSDEIQDFSIHDLLRTLELISVILAITIFLLFFLFSESITTNFVKSDGLSIETIQTCLIYMGLGTSLRFIEGFYRAAIYGLEHQVWFNIVYSIIQVLRFAGVLLVLFLIADANIETFFLWQIYISLVSVILLAWKTYKVLPEVNNSPTFSLNLAYKVRKFAGGMFFISLTTFAWKQSDQLFLFALLPLTDYGNFMLATTFCSSLILIAAPITQAYFPRLVNLISSKKEDELLTDYRLMSHIVLVLIGSVSFLFFTYSYEVVYIWTSSLLLAEELKLLVEFLSLSSLLIAMLYSPYNFLIAKGITNPILVLNISGLIIILPSIFYLVPIYGAIGIILVKIILDILRFFVYSILLKKYFSKLNLLGFYKENLIPLIGPLFIIQLSTFISIDPMSNKYLFIIYFALIYLVSFSIAVTLSSSIKTKLKEYILQRSNI